MPDEVETLRLPLSGLLCQRRSDGRWRFVQQAQYDDEQTGRHKTRPDDWAPPELQVEVGGRSELADGSHDKAGWWLLYGDNRDGPSTVTLSDGQTPPIRTFGPLWICEWVSPWQEARVSVAGESRRFFHRIPGYLRRRADDE